MAALAATAAFAAAVALGPASSTARVLAAAAALARAAAWAFAFAAAAALRWAASLAAFALAAFCLAALAAAALAAVSLLDGGWGAAEAGVGAVDTTTLSATTKATISPISRFGIVSLLHSVVRGADTYVTSLTAAPSVPQACQSSRPQTRLGNTGKSQVSSSNRPES